MGAVLSLQTRGPTSRLTPDLRASLPSTSPTSSYTSARTSAQPLRAPELPPSLLHSLLSSDSLENPAPPRCLQGLPVAPEQSLMLESAGVAPCGLAALTPLPQAPLSSAGPAGLPTTPCTWKMCLPQTFSPSAPCARMCHPDLHTACLC